MDLENTGGNPFINAESWKKKWVHVRKKGTEQRGRVDTGAEGGRQLVTSDGGGGGGGGGARDKGIWEDSIQVG